MAMTQKAFCSTKPRMGAGRCRSSVLRVSCKAHAGEGHTTFWRRAAAAAAAATVLVGSQPAALAASMLPQEFKMLCDAECTARLEGVETVSLPSGLKYKEIQPGSGPTVPVGFQVVANYVAMTPNLRVFDSSLEKGKPYDIRVGAGQVIRGLDEALMTMQPGSIWRLYIPGELAFPKGLKSAPGRPAVPASTPVVFDVQLLYIPGLEADE